MLKRESVKSEIELLLAASERCSIDLSGLAAYSADYQTPLFLLLSQGFLIGGIKVIIKCHNLLKPMKLYSLYCRIKESRDRA